MSQNTVGTRSSDHHAPTTNPAKQATMATSDRLDRRCTSDVVYIRLIAEDTGMTAVQRMTAIADIVADYQRNVDATPLWKAITDRARDEVARIRRRRYPTPEPHCNAVSSHDFEEVED